MDEIKEKDQKTPEDKIGRRSFFAKTYKYFLGFGAFTIASLFGLKRDGEIRLGKMKNNEFGLSEAHGTCSYGSDCAGGGGECSYGSSCSGGGGQCSYGSSCGGGGGQCSYGSDCAGR